MFFAWYGCFHDERTNKMDDLGLVLGNLHMGRVQFWGTQGPRLYILVQLVSIGRSIHGNTNKKKLKKWPLNPYYMRWWSLASEDLQETITPKYRGVLPINCPVNQFCEYPLVRPLSDCEEKGWAETVLVHSLEHLNSNTDTEHMKSAADQDAVSEYLLSCKLQSLSTWWFLSLVRTTCKRR